MRGIRNITTGRIRCMWEGDQPAPLLEDGEEIVILQPFTMDNTMEQFANSQGVVTQTPISRAGEPVYDMEGIQEALDQNILGKAPGDNVTMADMHNLVGMVRSGQVKRKG